MKALNIGSRPIAGSTEPRAATHRIAAAPARMPDTKNAIAMTRLALMPIRRTTGKLSAAARIAMPSVVLRKHHDSAASSTSVTPIETICTTAMSSDPIETVEVSTSGVGIAFGRAEISVWKRVCRMMLTARLASSSVGTPSPRSGRKATRSMSTAATPAARTPRRAATRNGIPACRPKKIV